MSQPLKKEQTFLDVITWVRTNKPEKVAELFYHVLCKGVELGLNSEIEDRDEAFDTLCGEYEGTPAFVSMLCDQIENAEEPYTPGVKNPFKSLIVRE